MNKAKKPLGMALFLPLILTFASFIDVESSPYHRHMGILGGSTASAAEPDYSLDNAAMLQAVPSPFGSSVISSDSNNKIIEEGIMETALFPGVEAGFAGKQSGNYSSAEGPYLEGYFAMPANGFNWGKLHPHNAVDIANDCGTNVTTSADGMVNETSIGLWNGDYGNYILISHPNGTKTRYAHLAKVLVSVGQRVKKGDLIGKMGETGNATGCHVHFEIIGAANPFAK